MRQYIRLCYLKQIYFCIAKAGPKKHFWDSTIIYILSILIDVLNYICGKQYFIRKKRIVKEVVRSCLNFSSTVAKYFKEAWKICLTFRSQRWLVSNLNLVSNFILPRLWQLKMLFGHPHVNFNILLLKIEWFSEFLIHLNFLSCRYS